MITFQFLVCPLVHVQVSLGRDSDFVSAKEDEEDAKSGEDLKLEEKEIQPVGQDYIEEIKNDDGELLPVS